MRSGQTYRFPFARYPAVRVAILLATGIIAGTYAVLSLETLFWVLGLLTAVWFLSDFVLRKACSLPASRLATVSYLFWVVTAAAILSTVQLNKYGAVAEHSKPLQLYEGETLQIDGQVIDTGITSGGRQSLVVKVQTTLLPDSVTWKQPYQIRLYKGENVQDSVSAGTTLLAEVTLWKFPEKRNPHEFDYGNWLIKRGIVAHGELTSVLIAERSRQLNWETIRTAVQRNIDNLFDERSAPLAKALFMGFKDELTPETRQEFARSGLSHIMAVSGLHVGFIVAPFWLLIPYFWNSKRGKWMGLILLTGLLTGYAGLTGFSASVCRASLMAWLLTFGKLFHKVRDSVNLTAVAAIILLLIKPDELFETGFQLSFSAVFIILLIMPEARRLIPLRYRYRKSGGLLTIILISVVVQIGLFPILVHYFGEFSIVGPIANALVVPVLSVTVPAGLAMSLLSQAVSDLAYAGIAPVKFSLLWIETIASALGSKQTSYIAMEQSGRTLFFIWAIGIGFIATLRIPALRWKWLIGFLIVVNLFFIEQVIQQPSFKESRITFFDVGQGDAAHIETPLGKHILVDTGRWSPARNSGEEILIPYFNARGIDHLDAIILSHPHADHIGGAAAILKEMSVGKIVQSGYKYDSEIYNEYIRLAQKKNVEIVEPSAGELIAVDPSVQLFVLAPAENERLSSNPNNHSLVVKYQYGQNSVLFSGDAEIEQEIQMTNRYGDFLKSDIYKVGHHGSKTSSSEKFINQVNPTVSVTSLGFRNIFGHPSPEVVGRLQEFGKKQKYTSLSGAVIYSTNGVYMQEQGY